ncbi:MAG TPA: 16S rRNA (cytosine(967)-C(5))-methyltransferase RsmB [Chthoniobacterales bacterium]|jgi:16S rRNA (cytosine967-C5)-methyltransferase
MNSARSLALEALVRWRKGREFANSIASDLMAGSSLGVTDRAFTLEIFYGVLRNLTLLDFWIDRLRSDPLEAAARDLLRLGLYQIMVLKVAPHAAVFETVELAPARTRRLINAVLRRALREKVSLTNLAKTQSIAVRYSQPAFLIERWARPFGDEATLDFCRWNNQPALVYARVNRLKLTTEEFLQLYPESSLLPDSTNFVALSYPVAAAQSGDSYIQDPSTAIACELLAPHPGERVLDACAAPGGKSAYLAEMMTNEGILIAVDREESRLQRLRENFVRLGVKNARIVACDWTNDLSVRAAGLAEGSFDKILLDAPCTNTGVMRRRVDLRWRLRPDDFARMAQEQLTILRAVAPLLKPGGSLVYSTCSVEREENDEVVRSFLAQRSEFCLTTRKESLPFRDHFDGAFAAQLLHRGEGLHH